MKGRQEIELELAWLIKYLPRDFSKHKHTLIRQGYLEGSDRKIKDIRIREKGKNYTYTVKYFVKSSKETGYTKEVTRKLSKEEFDTFWKKASNKTRKIRHYYPLSDGLIAEVDVYKDNLEGLVVAEVEFPSVLSYKSFVKPDWFGKEVTDSKGIYPPFIAGLNMNQVNKINDGYVQKEHEFD